MSANVLRILEEMLEDVEELTSTHDTKAANGKGINMYERIALSKLKDKINFLKKIHE